MKITKETYYIAVESTTNNRSSPIISIYEVAKECTQKKYYVVNKYDDNNKITDCTLVNDKNDASKFSNIPNNNILEEIKKILKYRTDKMMDRLHQNVEFKLFIEKEKEEFVIDDCNIKKEIINILVDDIVKETPQEDKEQKIDIEKEETVYYTIDIMENLLEKFDYRPPRYITYFLNPAKLGGQYHTGKYFKFDNKKHALVVFHRHPVFCKSVDYAMHFTAKPSYKEINEIIEFYKDVVSVPNLYYKFRITCHVEKWNTKGEVIDTSTYCCKEAI